MLAMLLKLWREKEGLVGVLLLVGEEKIDLEEEQV